MRYVWDPAKDVLNRRKHRLSLDDGIPALEDPECESWIDARSDYGEERIITLGRNKSALLVVVAAEQAVREAEQETTCIISVRKATKHETEWYDSDRK